MKFNCNLCGSCINSLNKISIYPNYFPEPLKNKYAISLFCSECFHYLNKDPEFGKEFFIYNMHIKEVIRTKKEFLKDSIFKINPETEVIEVFDNSIYYNFKFFIVSQMIKFLSYSAKKMNIKHISDDNFYMLKRNFLSGNLGIDKHQILMWKSQNFSEFRPPFVHQVNATKVVVFHFSSYIVIANMNIFEGFDVEYKDILLNRLNFKCNVYNQSNYLSVLSRFSGVEKEIIVSKKGLDFFNNKYL